MVPKVAKGGSSFGGAGRYYLGPGREKERERGISDYMVGTEREGLAQRVEFAEVLNMQADTPQQAFGQMQERYKAYQDFRANKAGRKLEQPVYSYSLSWSPTEEPSKEEMMAAARSTMLTLGLDGCQAVVVAHNDKAYKHIHVIVNKVQEDFSPAAHPSFDKRRLSKWAEAYERSRGQIFCKRRVENNLRREQGEFVKDTQGLHRGVREQESQAAEDVKVDFKAINRTAKFEKWAATKDELFRKQASERNSVWRVTQARFAMGRVYSREANRLQWADLYSRQREQRKELKRYSVSVFERAVFVFSNREKLAGIGISRLRGMIRLISSQNAFLDAGEGILLRERSKLSEVNNESYKQEAKVVWIDHKREYDKLRAEQKTERDTILGSRKVKTGGGNEESTMSVVSKAVEKIAVLGIKAQDEVMKGAMKSVAVVADVAAKSYFGDQVQGEPPAIAAVNAMKENPVLHTQKDADKTDDMLEKSSGLRDVKKEAQRLLFTRELQKLRSPQYEKTQIEDKQKDKSRDFER